MVRELSEMRENPSEKSEMSELAFASHVMRDVIAPVGSGASKGERVRTAARRLQWSMSRARDVWYADERVSLKACELKRIEEVSGLKYGRQEVADVNALLARADALLEGENADSNRQIIAALREVIRLVARTRING